MVSLHTIVEEFQRLTWQSWVLVGSAVAVVLSVVAALLQGRQSKGLLGLGKGRHETQVGKSTLGADGYVQLFDKAYGEQRRLQNYATVVNSYYDLATDFYEYGWGSSFHFAQSAASEPLQQSLARHEHFLALKLQLNASHTSLDVGCGVGGPAREIARFSGARVVGLNNNEYQCMRADRLTAQQNLQDHCQFVKGDFMNAPFRDNQFDAAYAIEATCHAPDRVGCYAEVLRCVKPGGYFAGYEWATTDKFDKHNPAHAKLIDDIQVGNGLPGVISTRKVIAALKDAGWEVLEYADLAEPVPYYPVPWYQPFEGTYSIKGFRTTTLGIMLTSAFCWIFETLRLLPSGTYNTQQFLIRGAMGLREGGRTGTFTPMFFFLCRKPLEGESRRRTPARK